MNNQINHILPLNHLRSSHTKLLSADRLEHESRGDDHGREAHAGLETAGSASEGLDTGGGGGRAGRATRALSSTRAAGWGSGGSWGAGGSDDVGGEELGADGGDIGGSWGGDGAQDGGLSSWGSWNWVVDNSGASWAHLGSVLDQRAGE